MKIHTTKQMALEALAPFARMSSKEPRILVKSECQSLSFTGRDERAQLTMAVRAAPPCTDGKCVVEHGLLRAAVESLRSEDITLESCGSGLTVRSSDADAVAVPAMGAMETMTVPDRTDTVALPTGFAGFLLMALQSAGDDDTRPVLQGVNISPKGIAATDGKQLNSIPLPMTGLRNDVTLPPSALYSALRKMRWTSLSHWDVSGTRHAAIRGDGFTLVVKAIAGLYPDYWKVFPDEQSLDISATIREDGRDMAMGFLKSVPRSDDARTEIWVHPDRIELRDGNGRLLAVPASCGSGNLPCGVYCNAMFMHQALRLGHSTFRLGSRAIGPIVASGASGRFLFMPLSGRPAPRASTTATCTKAATPTTRTTANMPTTANIQTTAKQKETTPMTQNTSINGTVGAAHAAQPTGMAVTVTLPKTAPSPLPAPAAQEQDPLAELSASLTCMRDSLDELRARLLDAGRKIREAIIQQRQKERVYLETARKLDCIRKAV